MSNEDLAQPTSFSGAVKAGDQKLSKTNKDLNLESSSRPSTVLSSPPVQLPPVSQMKPLPRNLVLFGVKITKRPATSIQSFFFPIQNLSSACFQPAHLSCQDPPEMSGHTPSHSPTVPPTPFNWFPFMLESLKMSTLTPLPKLEPLCPLRQSLLLMSLLNPVHAISQMETPHFLQGCHILESPEFFVVLESLGKMFKVFP